MFDMIEMLGHSGYDLRSSIILTYRLDLPLYDGLIRRALNRAGVWNQITFCDFSCYVQDIQSQTAAVFAGKHYSVTPIWQAGAFHPKVYMLLGPRHGRLLVGSGNATVGGLIRNAEVFGLFDFDADKAAAPHMAFQAVFGFVEDLGSRASDIVRKQIKSARQMAPWLTSPTIEDGRKILIGGSARPELLSQILTCLPTNKVDDLVVCSSSFDRDLSGIRRLASLSKAKPVCIVQPEHVELDGQAVRKLGGSVDWRPFADPYPAEKRQRKDVRAHAKILIFGHGSSETCVFGSANASAPALSSTNTEVTVVLQQRSKGEIVKHLGLGASLKAKSILKELSNKQWDPISEERPESRFSCLLSAVAAIESGYRLSFASGLPPRGSCLALSDRCVGRPRATALIQREGESFIAHSVSSDDAIRIGWITRESGEVLSNAVAITWPMVASPRKAGGGGTKASQYLAAMQDGAVLGTVLFELLDQFRDFEVIQAGSGRRTSAKKEGAGDGKTAAEHSAEFFYTDAKADAINGHHWTGDRIDLDILASLVQPLSPVGAPKHIEDEDDSYDDAKLDEEAEHRQIEAQKGKATGEEKRRRDDTSSEKLEAAVKRLERRLNRAATSIEESLQYLENLQSLAPNGVARQIWMAHIGAFLTDRITESADGDEFVCLDPWCFAAYVLRVCRALAGSKKVGGFLDKLAKTSWEGFDGEALTKGFAFLWTCVTWSAAYMVHYYSNGEGKEEFPESIAVGSAELVAARFIWKVSCHCKEPDRDNLQRRFPAWDSVPPKQMERTTKRLQEIVQLMQSVEGSGSKEILGAESDTESLKAGTLVHNPAFGVTMLAKDGAPRSYYLVNLSQSGDEPKKYGALVAPVLFNGKPYRLFQRTDESSAA
jgi:hypothetical protein